MSEGYETTLPASTQILLTRPARKLGAPQMDTLSTLRTLLVGQFDNVTIHTVEKADE